MLSMKDSIDELDSRELLILNRAFQSQLESAQIIPLIAIRARHLMKNSNDIELLSSAAFYSLPDQRIEMTEYLDKMINSSDVHPENDLQILFKVLRLLKISDMKLCNSFWEKVIESIQEHKNESIDNSYQIARFCHRYMHFNNNLGGKKANLLN